MLPKPILPMGNIRTEITIAATLSDVWRVLSDTAAWPEWNPLVTSFDGVPEEGRRVRIRLKVKALPAFRVPVCVSALKPGERFSWTFTLPFGILRAEHSFSLSEGPDGSTRFFDTERFTGLLGGIAGTLMNRFFLDDYRGMDRAIAERVAPGR